MMNFRTREYPSLGRRLRTVMAAPASVGVTPAMLDEYRALGGDALHLHGEGGETHSRGVTGRWLRDRGLREEMFLCTPLGHAGWDEQNARPMRRLDAAALAEDIAENCELLGTDYLDLVYLSEDDPSVDVGELLEPLVAQRARGRIRSFGVSEWSPERIRAAGRWAQSRGVPRIAAVITTELALLTPSEPLWPEYTPFDAAMSECVAAEGLSVLAWLSDLNQGMCRFGASDPVTTMKPAWVRRWQGPKNDATVARVNQFAAKRSLDARAVNSAYLLNQPFAVGGLVALGAPQCADLATYAGISHVALSETDRQFLEGNG